MPDDLEGLVLNFAAGGMAGLAFKGAGSVLKTVFKHLKKGDTAAEKAIQALPIRPEKKTAVVDAVAVASPRKEPITEAVVETAEKAESKSIEPRLQAPDSDPATASGEPEEVVRESSELIPDPTNRLYTATTGMPGVSENTLGKEGTVVWRDPARSPPAQATGATLQQPGNTPAPGSPGPVVQPTNPIMPPDDLPPSGGGRSRLRIRPVPTLHSKTTPTMALGCYSPHRASRSRHSACSWSRSSLIS